MPPIIEIKDVGKKYNIVHERGGYVTIRDVMMNVIKSPFSFLKTKVKAAVGFSGKEEFWALKKINFSVQKGEVVGIIGRNGAGKSTLLKILSQITPPTTGEIRIRGRVGSLLEVGTGFHPELTGRENIFLNGAILGMGHAEIARKFDEIVAFAGIGKFLDTPVKRYSSGMYVRLAFSVAAHMEPDILIIDEVLAVGDAEFQKKCLGKMSEITEKDGRTILFVSHNIQSIAELCSRTILLKDGEIAEIGKTDKVIEKYMNESFKTSDSEIVLPEKQHSDATFTKISITNERGLATKILEYPQDFTISVDMKVLQTIYDADISISLKNSRGIDIVFSSLSDTNKDQLKTFTPGTYSYKVRFPGGLLMPDTYSVRISIHNPGTLNIDTREDVTNFKIEGSGYKRAINYGHGAVSIPTHWTHEERKYEKS